MSIFGTRMKSLRDKKGETQNQVGKVLGKSRESVKKYEKGDRQPDIDSIANLAKHFDISADYILGLTDVEYRPGEHYPEYKELEKYFKDKIFIEYMRLAVAAYENKLDISELKNTITELINKK